VTHSRHTSAEGFWTKVGGATSALSLIAGVIFFMSDHSATTSATSSSTSNGTGEATPELGAESTVTPSIQISAAQVINEITSQTSFTKASVVYDGSTDPNHLLGRSGGYVSKASFTDSRIPPSSTGGAARGDVLLGGSVEVYPSAAGAAARSRYIGGIAQAMPGIAEYDYLAGPVLVRVSGLLTPQQAESYDRALRELHQ
jgi:hypothetical protein